MVHDFSSLPDEIYFHIICFLHPYSEPAPIEFHRDATALSKQQLALRYLVRTSTLVEQLLRNSMNNRILSPQKNSGAAAGMLEKQLKLWPSEALVLALVSKRFHNLIFSDKRFDFALWYVVAVSKLVNTVVPTAEHARICKRQPWYKISVSDGGKQASVDVFDSKIMVPFCSIGQDARALLQEVVMAALPPELWGAILQANPWNLEPDIFLVSASLASKQRNYMSIVRDLSRQRRIVVNRVRTEARKALLRERQLAGLKALKFPKIAVFGTLATIVLVLLVVYFTLVTVYWAVFYGLARDGRKDMERTLFPLLAVSFVPLMLFPIPILIYAAVVSRIMCLSYHARDLPSLAFVGALVALASCLLLFAVLLLLKIVSVPGSVPWLLVLSPIIVLVGCFALFNLVALVRFVYTRRNTCSWFAAGQASVYLGRAVVGALSVACFVLIAIQLQFPDKIHIAYCFIPMYCWESIVLIGQIVLDIGWALLWKRAGRFPPCRHIVNVIVALLLPITTMASHIAMSIAGSFEFVLPLSIPCVLLYWLLMDEFRKKKGIQLMEVGCITINTQTPSITADENLLVQERSQEEVSETASEATVAAQQEQTAAAATGAADADSRVSSPAAPSTIDQQVISSSLDLPDSNVAAMDETKDEQQPAEEPSAAVASAAAAVHADTNTSIELPQTEDTPSRDDTLMVDIETESNLEMRSHADAELHDQEEITLSPTKEHHQFEDDGTSSATPLNRVKLYHLNNGGTWDDMGTGHVSCEDVTSKGGLCLVMISEKSDSSQRQLLESRISRDDIYQLQGDSLIVWCDPDTGIDTALSFQESDGCCTLWDEIRRIQGRKPDSHSIIAKNKVHDSLEDEEDDLGDDDLNSSLDDLSHNGAGVSIGSSTNGGGHLSIELPEPSLSRLQAIAEILTSQSLIVKTRISQAIQSKQAQYLEKLFDVFDEAETLSDTESLYTLFDIFKHIVLLDEHKIFDFLFQEKNFLRLIGVFEYDPELQHLQHRTRHRQYFKTKVVFRKVIAFSDSNVENRVHYSFRIGYLKDTVLAKHLDDATFTTLNTMIHFNNLEIIKAIKDDKQFLKQLFDELEAQCELIKQEQQSQSEGAEQRAAPQTQDQQRRRRLELVKLLQEYNMMLKQVQGYIKDGVYRTLLDHHLLNCLEYLLLDSQSAVRHASTDILCSIISYDPSTVREFILNEFFPVSTRGRSQLLESMIHVITSETELGIQDNLSDTFKTLLDPEHIGAKKDSFMDMFYLTGTCGAMAPTGNVSYAARLMRPFECFGYSNDQTQKHDEYRQNLSQVSLCQSFMHVLDVLASFVLNHSVRIKSLIVEQKMLLKASNLLACASLYKKDVALQCIKFIRTCVSQQDMAYSESIVKHDVFRPLMQLWRRNGPNKYNLLNSAMIDLFELIRSAGMKKLIRYCVEEFRADFEQVTYVDTFKLLIKKYEDLPPATPSQSQLSSQESQGLKRTVSSVRGLDESSRWLESEENEAPHEDQEGSSSPSKSVATPDMAFPSISKKESDEDEDDEFAIFTGKKASTVPKVSKPQSFLPSGKSATPLVNGSPRPGTPIKSKIQFSLASDAGIAGPGLDLSPDASAERITGQKRPAVDSSDEEEEDSSIQSGRSIAEALMAEESNSDISSRSEQSDVFTRDKDDTQPEAKRLRLDETISSTEQIEQTGGADTKEPMSRQDKEKEVATESATAPVVAQESAAAEDVDTEMADASSAADTGTEQPSQNGPSLASEKEPTQDPVQADSQSSSSSLSMDQQATAPMEDVAPSEAEAARTP